MSVIPIFESEVSCLSSIVDLQHRCTKEKVGFSKETNRFLLYLTVKKVGPSVAQKVVSKLVANGEITWDKEEEFEVEQILDYVEEDGVEFFLIKWRGWSHAHNSWEPKDNLDCINLMDEYHRKNGLVALRGTKRKFDEIKNYEDERDAKRSRVDELFRKLTACKEIMTPLRLISLTSPDKGKTKAYRGVVTCDGLKAPKYNNTKLMNPRTKAYKQKKIEIKRALKDWEKHLNEVSTDPVQITVENDIDLEGPPENFIYINDYKPGPGIEIPNDPIIGCECTDCLTEKGGCCAAQFGVEFAYYKHKNLRIHPGRPIYECNKRCKCGPECSNRVVQQGRKHKVCIFRTSNGRGFGVKAMQRIKSGSFVMEYVGEVISSEEAEIRGKTYDSVGRTYLFDLDFNDGDCPFTVDAAVYGNVSHFVNHSCDPNLEVYSVWINTLDTRLPRIALFSRRNIEKGEELTFDYMSSKVHSPLEESTGDIEVLDDTTSEIPSESEATNPAESAETITTSVDENDNSVATVTNTAAVKTDTDIESEVIDVDSMNSSMLSDSGESMPTLDEIDAIDETGDNSSVFKRVEDIGSSEESDGNIPPVLSPQKAAAKTNSSPRKAVTKQTDDLYRMVCQCGAKNCRKFVF